jgi:hypothetical protein
VAGAGLVEVVKVGVLTRAKARHCRVGRSRGFENPLPRTEVRGWHRLVRSLAEIGTQGLNRLRKNTASTTGGAAEEIMPQRLKPSSFQMIYVRAEARTLQRPEYFRSPLTPVPFEDRSISAALLRPSLQRPEFFRSPLKPVPFKDRSFSAAILSPYPSKTGVFPQPS